MPSMKPLTIDGVSGTGYIEATRNTRGGQEGFGVATFPDGGPLLSVSQRKQSMTYIGSVWIDGVESRRSLEVFFRTFDGDRASLVACLDARFWKEETEEE